MMIMGGGIVSWLQGCFRSYRYPKQLYCRRFMFCLFGFMLGRSVVFLKNQGVNLDSKVGGALVLSRVQNCRTIRRLKSKT
jgi:hypothetical protein